MRRSKKALFDHLVGAGEDQGRDRQAERRRGLQVDHQLEGRRLLDRQIGGLRPLQDPVDEVGLPLVTRRKACSIGQQHPRIGIAALLRHTRR